MGQDEPEPIQPEGDDPGIPIIESPDAEVVVSVDDGPEPEGADPGRLETFSLEPEGVERLEDVLKRESDD